jgi:hypothetical protein
MTPYQSGHRSNRLDTAMSIDSPTRATSSRTGTASTRAAPTAGVSPLHADGASAVPLYRELQRRLTRALSEGTWPPGAALPSESKLAQQHGFPVVPHKKVSLTS